MFQHSDANPEELKCLMKSTFYTQRQHVKSLREEWPFWFDELGMSVHFKELTGIDLKETFTRNLDLKGKRLLNYTLRGCSDDVKEMLLLLLSYFDEKESMLKCLICFYTTGAFSR